MCLCFLSLKSGNDYTNLVFMAVTALSPRVAPFSRRLWCGAWCSMESLPNAKTIDMCNNPMTKVPKLEMAPKIAPEWTTYDEQVGDNLFFTVRSVLVFFLWVWCLSGQSFYRQISSSSWK
jgi:hypothetical protein